MRERTLVRFNYLGIESVNHSVYGGLCRVLYRVICTEYGVLCAVIAVPDIVQVVQLLADSEPRPHRRLGEYPQGRLAS